MALILARTVAPASKLATISWWPDTTLACDLGVTDAGTDEVYAVMDWLTGRQTAIEKKLATRHLDPKVNPSRMAMFGLSSSWVTGRHCELAARGYSRDGKKSCEQIEYGLLTDPEGRPVAIRVLPGNTADPTAFTHAVTAVKDTFGLENILMVGDRGMITSARITALAELGGIGWLTALRAPQIAALAADTGPLQRLLFESRTSPRSHTPTTPGNDWSRAATRSSPPNAPANAANYSPRPRRNSHRSSPPWRPVAAAARTRSVSGSGRSSANSRWANTST